MPIFIKDIADFIQMMVTGFESPLYYGLTWLILSYSIAIPLSFYVGSRIKKLFI
jgi:hypothetical protein